MINPISLKHLISRQCSTKNPALLQEIRGLAVVHGTLPGYRPVTGQEQILECWEGTIICNRNQPYGKHPMENNCAVVYGLQAQAGGCLPKFG